MVIKYLIVLLNYAICTWILLSEWVVLTIVSSLRSFSREIVKLLNSQNLLWYCLVQ